MLHRYKSSSCMPSASSAAPAAASRRSSASRMDTWQCFCRRRRRYCRGMGPVALIFTVVTAPAAAPGGLATLVPAASYRKVSCRPAILHTFCHFGTQTARLLSQLKSSEQRRMSQWHWSSKRASWRGAFEPRAEIGQKCSPPSPDGTNGTKAKLDALLRSCAYRSLGPRSTRGHLILQPCDVYNENPPRICNVMDVQHGSSTLKHNNPMENNHFPGR